MKLFGLEVTGSLGIGQTSPSKALHIGDASNNTGNGTIRLQGYSSGGSGNYHDIISYGDNIQFYRNTTLFQEIPEKSVIILRNRKKSFNWFK